MWGIVFITCRSVGFLQRIVLCGVKEWEIGPVQLVGWLSSLTPCHRATWKLVIAIPCVVDGSRISTFPYMTSCTCLSGGLAHWSPQGYLQLDAGCLGLKLQTGRSWPHIFRTIRLQSWLYVGMFCKRMRFCVSYTGCPTRYRTRHFFNNFTTNEDIATKFEVDLPQCVRNVTTS